MNGIILHESDSIENGNYFGIFSKIIFDNTDNNTFDIETIKKDPKKLKLINEAYLFLFKENLIAPQSTPSTPPRTTNTTNTDKSNDASQASFKTENASLSGQYTNLCLMKNRVFTQDTLNLKNSRSQHSSQTTQRMT